MEATEWQFLVSSTTDFRLFHHPSVGCLAGHFGSQKHSVIPLSMGALIVIPMQYIYLFMRIWRCVSLQLGIYLQELHSCVARAHATLHSCAIYPNDCYSTLKISQFEMQLTLIMPWHLIYSAPRNEIVFVFNWAVAAMHFVFFFWMNICIVLDLILHNAFSDIHIHNTRAHCESCYVCKCNDGNGKLIFVVALYFIQNRTIIIFFSLHPWVFWVRTTECEWAGRWI